MRMNMSTCEILTQPLQDRAINDPSSTAVVFLGEDGSEQVITAREFDAQASRFAVALAELGVQTDDLVILVLRQTKELLFAFWGALYLGAIGSIFPFLTEKLDPVIYRQRVKELVSHSKAKAVVTYPEFQDDLVEILAGVGCRVLSTAEIPLNTERTSSSDWPRFDPSKIAFLQHSSGTTGLQKGVTLSHRAVLNQLRAYSASIQLDPRDVIVSWLPLYHDMGLIAGFVMPLVSGNPLVLMSPFKWVRDPKILLQAIHKYRGTLCWLPNFAYNHIARSVRAGNLEGLDLTSMRAFINCSEPVYLHSHGVFIERLSPCGVRGDMLSTCYAMAENTFAVTQHAIGRETRIDWIKIQNLQEERLALPAEPDTDGVKPMMSCGVPIVGTELCVVDDRFNPLPDRQVGEIALRSNCMLSGYYRRPDLTSSTIRSGWYLTGDMGYLADGELFITGRKKDLIIVGGKNIYPQDLETIANQIPGLVPGRVVAFGLFDESLGSENIVMVCELHDPNATAQEQHALEKELRRCVAIQSEVTVSDIRFVQKRWLIKTSSGKISRSSNREKYIREFLLSEK
jgi:fatty-acyl-CoA synthase